MKQHIMEANNKKQTAQVSQQKTTHQNSGQLSETGSSAQSQKQTQNHSFTIQFNMS